MIWVGLIFLGLLSLLALYDLTQKKHAILRNFPIIGHFRYILETIGPELRQYIVTSNDAERPFSRDERSWVYASSKKQNNFFGFGTDNDLERSPNHLVIKHAAFPIDAPGSPADSLFRVPSCKILGQARQRKHAFRPESVVNVSGMSFGSLSAAAVEALNRGSFKAKCLHNTGEGGVSPHHAHGGELIWQIGTGYFGCRDSKGLFCMDRFLETLARYPIKAVEIKLSQGAKPGKGGLLPAAKITPEIARIRGIPQGQDCVSPAAHSAFGNTDELLDFVERLGETSGIPIGIKAAVGQDSFWRELAGLMSMGTRGVDFIAIDGGEGGTGAGPLVFTDHVALPFKLAFSRVYRIFAERQLTEKTTFIGSGKLGFPETALFAFALGCDMINVGREPMMAIGCVQAQRCHTGHCPTGVATQSKWLQRGLDPTSKADRMANYIMTLRKEILWLCHACGVTHPALITHDHFEILDDRFEARTTADLFGYRNSWSLPSPADRREIEQFMQ